MGAGNDPRLLTRRAPSLLTFLPSRRLAAPQEQSRALPSCLVQRLYCCSTPVQRIIDLVCDVCCCFFSFRRSEQLLSGSDRPVSLCWFSSLLCANIYYGNLFLNGRVRLLMVNSSSHAAVLKLVGLLRQKLADKFQYIPQALHIPILLMQWKHDTPGQKSHTNDRGFNRCSVKSCLTNTWGGGSSYLSLREICGEGHRTQEENRAT